MMYSRAMLEPHTSLPYASFGKRLCAYGYDSLLITIATMLVSWQLGDLLVAAQPPLDNDVWMQAGLNGSETPLALMGEALTRTMNWQDVVLPLVISALYNIYFLTGNWQATPGKRFCKIYVVNPQGGRRAELCLHVIPSTCRAFSCCMGTLRLFTTASSKLPKWMRNALSSLGSRC